MFSIGVTAVGTESLWNGPRSTRNQPECHLGAKITLRRSIYSESLGWLTVLKEVINQVAANCVNYWLLIVYNYARVTPYMGVTSRAAKLVCAGPVKLATCTDFVAISRTILYFLQQLCFLATTWFFARQVWSVGGKMGNITMYLVFICSNVTLQNRFPVLPYLEQRMTEIGHRTEKVMSSRIIRCFRAPQPQFCEQFLYCQEGQRSFLSWTERFLARLDHYTPFEPILSSWKIKQRNVMRCKLSGNVACIT